MSYLDQILPQDSKSAQILGMANERARASQASDRDNRIAEIDRRIAELNEQIANWDGEGAIARYKFVYENDPSAYLTRFQNLRTHEQAKELADINHKNAMEIQKESQSKTDRQQAIDAWKQNSIDMEAAKYTLAAAQQAYDTANNSGDAEAIRKAGLELKRAQSSYNRIDRDNKALRDKVGAFMGFSQESDDDSKIDEKIESDAKAAEDFVKFQGDVERINSAVDNMPIDKNAKAAYVMKTSQMIGEFRDRVNSSALPQKKKNELLELADEKWRQLEAYAKPGSKGGKQTIKTAKDYEAAVKGNTRGEIRKNGVAWLKNAKALKANIPDIDAIIEEAAKLGYK